MQEERTRTRRLYDAVAASYAELLPDMRFEAPEDLAMIDAFVAALPHERAPRVLDAGCGPGRVLAHLRRLDPALQLRGVDLSAEMVALAREAHPDLSIEQGDLADLPAPSGSLDGVLAWYSIIHTVPDGLPTVTEEFHRVLAPGGLLLLAFQAGSGERSRTSAYGQEVDFHAVLHEPPDVERLLVAAGFEVLQVLDRPRRDGEHDRQAVLLARRR